MSDTSTTPFPSSSRAEGFEESRAGGTATGTGSLGHGRHRGQVSAGEYAAAPHGRHRKPAERPGQTGTAA